MQKLPTHIEAMLRVNQAGEYGAVRIYKGQMDTLKKSPEHKTLADMKEQEEIHLQTFNEIIVENNVRPTLLTPLWHIGGYLMGAVTGLMGEKAAHACTEAVENVIEEHYTSQVEALKNDPHPRAREFADLFEQFKEEEIAHKNLAIQKGASEAPFYKTLIHVVSFISKTAIALSKKI